MIVFDSSTLILVTKIELLDLVLREIGMEVAVPKAVEEECCHGKKTLDALMIQKAVAESRIKVKAVRNRRLVAKLQDDFSMATGESEAIALALQDGAALVGIDDRKGIQACKLLGVAFTTAVAILVRSREKGLLDRREALERFEALNRFGRYRSIILEEARRDLEK